ncbi:uncharacterized protein E0L32_010454 [Thyridium curvatum]|uniref:Rab-GAP TBC domain-containing protein n=1 Tax=Thyridium curvatum TaxID=1093900 RepID=A0A507ASJ9_9PEZI|nr:uncharacterized protein E0L32_010454 [Thyridium curvatum]TPX07879.1 hypothetical protein E0L32_010454 [Thyridium curvatum]
MAPQRFASVKLKNRPTVRVAAAFRDDASLVALRYEQTVQAEPPIHIIPIPPRNPARASRPPSGFSPTNSVASPIVVVPPSAPPREQHPALRIRSDVYTVDEENKRDSGLASTPSTVTTREESLEDLSFDKASGSDQDRSSYTSDRSSFTTTTTSTSQPQSQALSRAQSPEAGEITLESVWEDPRPAPPHPVAARDANANPAKSSSRRSGKTNRLRKKSMAEKGTATPAPPTVAANATSGNPQVPGASTPSPASTPVDKDFTPINTSIPTDKLLEDDFLTKLSFSKRGSVMFGGKRAFLAPSLMDRSSERAPGATAATRQNSAAATGDATNDPKDLPKALSIPNIRVLSVEVERESQKVRSLYESGEALNWEDGGQSSSLGERLEPTAELPSQGDEKVASPSSQDDNATLLRPSSTHRSSSPQRDRSPEKAFERAGGIEDWQDVNDGDVDRYGFISPKRPVSRATTSDTRSERLAPRRRNVLVKRPDSAVYSSSPLAVPRGPSRKVSARSLHTQNSEFSTASRRSARSSLRTATNLLPHNKDRKVLDEAGDMLTLTPGLSDIAEDEQGDKISEALKRKEWERSEKWRKMAKVVKKGEDGEGMDFEFDVKNQKLIDRTWKGIPDRWRAAAWYSFLATSAKRQGAKTTDQDIIAAFKHLQEISSPDDVQIDLDVPRTINRHIMFRRRYRGGQRLLFRVLHAISLYYPDIGYVQGMASLAATLLCYYDEERCFVMLVRMWDLRGLENLYQPGFDGLMTALKDLEKHWLGNRDVARKLNELCIDPTAYGTRWYLTLFNLSVPFPAQLRIWDVFMLLGDAPLPDKADAKAKAKAEAKAKDKDKDKEQPQEAAALFSLDILHAASSALIQALREVLLDSDFENAMKALTSWVPIKDEDLLMKVIRTEWKQHKGKKKG